MRVCLDNETRQQKIVAMFDDISPTYDRANRVLSMGIDVKWRRQACDEIYRRYKRDIGLIVDVACGTGDMMECWKCRADKAGRSVGRIAGVDPSRGMIGVGREKFSAFEFVVSDAANLPFDDNSADILSISYGIRNVVDREAALAEFARVIIPGGYIVILEFMKDEGKGVLCGAKNFYLNRVLPRLGGFISKNREAYEYLPNSIEGFLTSDMLQQELAESGFETEFVKSFSMNISTLLIARKI
jgi:demethylmenaquinone methyltransferase/2-methoxy-6-polyprenyl-1,4-benzoquinol methylase